MINFVISFGAVQGFIIGILLLIKGGKKQDFFYLALVLIGFAAILGRIVLIGIYENQSLLFINFILLISPALYFYTKEYSKDKKDILKFNKHFLPFLIINLAHIVFYLYLKNSSNYHIYITTIIKINEAFSIFYFASYLYLTYNTIKQNKLDYSATLYQLLKQLVFIFSLFFIIWVTYVLVEWFYFQYRMKLIFYYPMMLLLAVILYYISLQIIIKTQFLSDMKDTSKRKNFILEDKESEDLLNQLTLFMNKNKPFLNGDISLIILADLLDVNPKILSFVINEHIHKNFNDYINDWRVEEVKKKLSDEAYNHFKMLSIAFECGFNSKSTFNLAFKKNTGLSPSEYKKRLKMNPS